MFKGLKDKLANDPRRNSPATRNASSTPSKVVTVKYSNVCMLSFTFAG